GRMGGDHYCEAFGPAIFDVEKPLTKPGIGVDQLPDHIRLSKILTGNDLGQLANIKILPDDDAIEQAKKISGDNKEVSIHKLAKKLIAEGKVKEALTLLMTLDL
ncbi:MAG: flavin reductase family protein, partial [Bacteroidetes bacterium]